MWTKTKSDNERAATIVDAFLLSLDDVVLRRYASVNNCLFSSAKVTEHPAIRSSLILRFSAPASHDNQKRTNFSVKVPEWIRDAVSGLVIFCQIPIYPMTFVRWQLRKLAEGWQNKVSSIEMEKFSHPITSNGDIDNTHDIISRISGLS